MALIEHVWPWTQQPQEAPDVDWGCPLADKLIVLTVGGAVATPTSSGAMTVVSGAPRIAAGVAGVGPTFSGGAQQFISPAFVRSLSASEPFTLEVLCAFTASPNLAGIYGMKFNGGLPGYLRNVISYGGPNNRNIFFWGQGADASSGVDWRIDGSLQHVFVTRDGPVLLFYRDGVVIATASTPALTNCITQSVQFGDVGYGWASSPTGTIFKAATYARCLSAGEIAALSADPWQIYAPRRIRIPVYSSTPSAVPIITFVGAENILANSTGYRVSLDYA